MIYERVSESVTIERSLQYLFGEKNYLVERRPCTGKFRGHYDYSIVFGSGRRLFIGQDQRNYLRGLRKQEKLIRYFREHQSENTEKIKAALAAHNAPICDAAVDVVPYDGSTDLVVYGVVILTQQDGQKLLYRETTMHNYLVDGEKSGCSFDECMDHLLKDVCGDRAYCKIWKTEDLAPEQKATATKRRKRGISR